MMLLYIRISIPLNWEASSSQATVITHISFEGGAGRPKSGFSGASRRRRACARLIADLWISAAQAHLSKMVMAQ